MKVTTGTSPAAFWLGYPHLLRERHLSEFTKVRVYVVGVAVAAAIALSYAWFVGPVDVELWAIVSFTVVAFLLGLSPTTFRVAVSGTTSFVVHISAGLLFGAFWGGVVAAASTAANKVQEGRDWDKVLFNASQRLLSVTVAVLLYQRAFGASVPPSYLQNSPVPVAQVQRELFLFFVVAAVYFTINKALVGFASALSSGRPFREVWHLNFRGVVGYDFGASLLSLLVAWVYQQANRSGIGPIGLVVGVIPIVMLRHVYQMYRDLQSSGEELLELMVKAIEARDPYTSGHSLRVKELSRAIALELHLPARDLEEVETAALLHDVGKIHEEFAPLLRKEARLSPEETALMQTHAMRSADLVGIISKFRGGVQRAVRHHHERWDGQGYPDGLKGNDIPLASRIIIVSDTIDAMTTDRPYRKRLSLDIVVAELQKCRGTQFDPSIVDVAVSSVAVRRQIIGVNADALADPMRSKKVSSVASALWRVARQ